MVKQEGNRAKDYSDNVSAARKFLSYHDFEIQPATFKSNVTMPKITKIDDKLLDLDELRQVMARGRPNRKMRALIYTLFSSGMRIGEGLSIKVADVNLKEEPASIAVKANYRKAWTGRIAYISGEAREALKEIIDNNTPKDRLVFDYSGNLWQREKVASRTFREVVERAGLDDHGIPKINFHDFRKYFLTKGRDKIGEDAAHALCGYGSCLFTYYRKREEERKQQYLSLLPVLTLFGDDWMEEERARALRNLRVCLPMLGIGDEAEREQIMKDIEKFSPKMTRDEMEEKLKQMLKNSKSDLVRKWAIEPKSHQN